MMSSLESIFDRIVIKVVKVKFGHDGISEKKNTVPDVEARIDMSQQISQQ